MIDRLPQDALDDIDQALRAWAIHFDRKGDVRKVEEVHREILKLQDIRQRRRWTSRLRPYLGTGVEDFSAPRHDFTDNNGGWTQETDD